MTESGERRFDAVREIRRLAGVREISVLEQVLAERLSELKAEDAASLLLTIGLRTQLSQVRTIYGALVRLFTTGNPLPTHLHEEIYNICAAGDLACLVRYMLPIPPARTAHDDELRGDPTFDEIPLGTRKWKARGQNRDQLSRLALDPDPSVIRIWLDNPLNREADVVSLASRRPVSIAVLTEIATHRRWSMLRTVQETIARNPYSPAHLAASWLVLMPEPLLRAILQDTVLHPAVTDSARDLLEIRQELKEQGHLLG